MKALLLEPNIELEFTPTSIDTPEFGVYDKRYRDLIIESGDFSITVDATIYFEHNHSEGDYFTPEHTESTIEDVYVHSYEVFEGDSSVDIVIDEQLIKSNIKL